MAAFKTQNHKRSRACFILILSILCAGFCSCKRTIKYKCIIVNNTSYTLDIVYFKHLEKTLLPYRSSGEFVYEFEKSPGVSLLESTIDIRVGKYSWTTKSGDFSAEHSTGNVFSMESLDKKHLNRFEIEIKQPNKPPADIFDVWLK